MLSQFPRDLTGSRWKEQDLNLQFLWPPESNDVTSLTENGDEYLSAPHVGTRSVSFIKPKKWTVALWIK